MSSLQHFIKNLTKDKNALLPAIAIAGILIAGGLIYANMNGGISLAGFGMSNEKIAQTAVDYINNNNLAPSPATVVAGSVTSEYGLVKFKIDIGGNAFDSYVTRDGKMLFPQVIALGGTNTAAGGNTNTGGAAPKVTAADLPKSDNPMMDVFVVSRCPYGLQVQRAMASAIAAVPELGKYMTVRYIGAVGGTHGITAMHGDAEALENLRQICLRDEQPTKYWPYVSCQMKAGDTAGCEKSSGVDSAKLSSCLSDKSRGVEYAKKDFELQNKYGANASPTTILGNSTISEFDFGGRSADALKSIICAASTTQPSFCSEKLDTNQAATSFSLTYASATGSAPTNSAAGCAPVQ